MAVYKMGETELNGITTVPNMQHNIPLDPNSIKQELVLGQELYRKHDGDFVVEIGEHYMVRRSDDSWRK